MHPGIRIVCFLVVMAFLARADFPLITFLLFVFPLLAFRQFFSVAKRTWQFVIRLRWFWLSIVLLYGLMTPGDVLFSLASGVYITTNGLIAGVQRSLGLLVVLIYFSWLISTVDEHGLLAAVFWLLGPLRYIGISVDKLGLRISLTLRAATQLQQQSEKTAKQQSGLKKKWLALPERLSTMFNQVLRTAKNESVEDIDIEYTQPGLLQWLYPVTLSGLFWTINRISF